MNQLEPHITNWIFIAAMVAFCAPLSSSVLAAFISPRYAWVISLTAPLNLLLSVGAAAILFYQAWETGPYNFSVPWFTLNEHTIGVGLLIDNLTLVMVLLVSLISFLVHLYSTGYMAGDPSIRRYFVMLGFFTTTMLGIVLADNLLTIFIFWELVGFSSYMLIGHWTDLPEAGNASRKAFVMNRLGDLGFIVGLMIVYQQTGSFQFAAIQIETTLPWETAASLCFFFGIIGKSAQFPLLTWLPDAMAGPSPVSALIHAATMVAAGVFLLARIYFLFTPLSLNVVLITGLITSVAGALAALNHVDLKRILAYSTISQLGFMMIGMGIGAKEGSILHLFTHAFFKAGLFLAAGSIIHSLHQAQQGTLHHFDVQDIRSLGGLKKTLPVTFLIFLICGASLAGLPFFSGFQSKESILMALIPWGGVSLSWKGLVLAIVFLIIFLTVCYTYRLIWFVFIVPAQRRTPEGFSVAEVPFFMRLPMIVLASGSLWWTVSWNPFSFSGWYNQGEGSIFITALSLAIVVTALGYSFLYFRRRQVPSFENSLSIALAHTLYLDKLYHATIGKAVTSLSLLLTIVDRKYIDGLLHSVAYAQVTAAHFVGWLDRNLVDGTVIGIARLAGGIGVITRSFQGGKIQLYIFWAGVGLFLLMLFLIT
jgi:NADH-quinone oxidoreductase subunit L